MGGGGGQSPWTYVNSPPILGDVFYRIYIKKVRKFPEYAVDIHMEKRGLKNAMDKAFHELKSAKLDVIGQER